MDHVDMRSLPAAAQQERRRQVIGLRESGLTHEAIAAQTGLTRTGVFNICRRFAERGLAGLKSGPRGPAPGTGRHLDAEQEAAVQSLIRRHTPDELGLPFALWSRGAVRELIWRRYRVRLAVRTMGTYLARWGFTPSAALPSASLMEPSAAPPRGRCGGLMSRTRRRCAAGSGGEYPAIAARAKQARGVV
jgi:transposase